MRIYNFLKLSLAFLSLVPMAECSATSFYSIKKNTTIISKGPINPSSLNFITSPNPLSIADNAPRITATGNQSYCPGTSLKIVTDVSITNTDITDTGTEAIYIQISSGYVNGQDLIQLANPTLHPTIISSWDAPSAKLKLSSPTGADVLYSEFVKAIKDIEFSNSSTSPSGIRNFSITIGQANYLPRNGHYYLYVPNLGINWTAAKAAAETSTYYGLQGYLATITAADEAKISGEQAAGAGWIGGSDAEIEGIWKWMTGPESGTIFWNGLANGSTPNFAFWNSNEPNQAGNEDYAHITAPGIGIPGSWNDLSNTGDLIGNYQPKGYIVEYGGMPGELPLEISASTTITIPAIKSTTRASACGPGMVTLQATASNGTVNWYDNAGNPAGSGNSYTTPTLLTTTTYYVDAGCSTARTPITATIKSLPNLPLIETSSTSPVLYCQNATALPLGAIASTNCNLNWYTIASGGTASSSSPTPSTATVNSTKYYVSQTNTLTGCEGPRSEITVIVNPRPLAPEVNNINYCQNETAVPLTATASTNCNLNWYTVATGGTSSSTSPTPSTITVSQTKYYVSQTINTTGCEGPRSEIIVTVNPLPTAPLVSNVFYCHHETTVPLTATASANCNLNWYTVATGGTSSPISPTPSTTTVNSTKYYVSQTNTLTGCEGTRSEITVIVNPLPILNDITITQCDIDLISDGKTLFNLTANNNLISTNYIDENFTYYTSLAGANSGLSADLISNDLSFENTTPSIMDIWVRVANKNSGCFSVAKLTLKVPATNLLSSYTITVPPVCDDFLDVVNNDRDGITTFNFSWTKTIIQNELPTNQTYTINYYRNQADALAELNDISNYRNIGYPNSQDIWVRIESSLDNACVGLGPYITLKVEALPFANPVIIPRQCDENHDGIFTFDTANLESTLLGSQTNVTVTYFDQNNAPLPSPFPNSFTTTSQTIKAVVTNNSTLQCYDETTIPFIVDDSPIALAIPLALTTACDDEPNPLDQDGKFVFDTTGFEATILGGQTGMIVKYYDQNNIELPSPLPNPFTTESQNIIARVENPLNTNCYASTALNFVVNPVPKINLNTNGDENELVCSNLPSFFVQLDTAIQDGSVTSNYGYVWSKDGNVLTSETAPTLQVNAEGTYTVEVTNSYGCSRIKTINVMVSDAAHIESIDIADLTDINTVTINVTGKGEYEFSIDDPNGFWQDSNFFNNVPLGIHDVYVNDKNGCGIVSQTIAIIGAPKFFTPNNDGYNDYWSVKGINQTFNSKSILYIFDRYGKLIKQWVPLLDQGWDGTFNGTPLPADDYWFTLKLEDGRETKGHFSLKR
ncbi:T9SS type B sorting domain-containing protein [Flavobacterium sp. XS2P24]|uniref:Ig-like domain-containing protein n=1 Tax=Flavobacterium sp. XS2P24 TaxID=3041249 RepID=UPI0024A8F916|nr:T9SS type B sorting domain-containing protein [Flavobacterium sp. XS2P24]MDI6048663.1 T9SS type B sorting domain-containing protein [Flavobacterium sp. XS2P24]